MPVAVDDVSVDPAWLGPRLLDPDGGRSAPPAATIIGNPAGTTTRIAWWRRAASLADQIDRIDRCCEQLILESLIGAAAAPMEGSADRVASVRRWIETHWRDDHDFDELARRQGLSPTHFRRLWQRNVGVPPHRFLIEGRLRHACRALAQTDGPIAEIARTHGFADPLYFSRRFRAFTGESASTYRRRYRGSPQF